MVSKIDFLFYSSEVEKTNTLDPTESLHAIKVLRKRQGDIIQVTDGKGGWFSCEITRPDPKSCGVRILSAEYAFQRPARQIYLAICPTKNSDRIEYFLEKSIEIGVSGIFFLKTKHTYPRKINLERLEKIALSAMKQSLKAYKPELHDLQPLPDFFKATTDFKEKYIAHLDSDAVDIMEISLSDKILVMIGPEGDFSKEELEEASENGFKTLTLGSSRLRTETAGVFAASILNARK